MLCRFIPNDYCNKIEIEYKKMFKKSDMTGETPLESLSYRTISSDVDIACMISPNEYYESLSDAKLLWVNTYISGNLYCFRISPDFQTVKFVQPNKTHMREYFSREDLSYALSKMRTYRDSIKEYCPIEYYNQFIDYLDRALKLKSICHNNMAYVGRLDLDQYTYVNDLVKFDNIEPEVVPTVEPVIVIQSPPIIEPVISFVDRWD